MPTRILVPLGVLEASSSPSSEEAAAQRRRELKEKLLRSDGVVVIQKDEVKDKNQKVSGETAIVVPPGQVSTDSSEEAAAKRRREIREKLLRGDEVVVTQEGEVKDKNQKVPSETAITVPPGKLATDSSEEAAAKRRREIREKLLRGDEVVVTQEGEVKDKNQKVPSETAITVPPGKLATDSSEEAMAKWRHKTREKLLRGDAVVVTQKEEVQDKNQKLPGETAIAVPAGILAASFHWYERDADLYREEVRAMENFFPQFRLEKLPDGRLSWVGEIRPRTLQPKARWTLQAIYDNNHPDNSNYGGSIKVYSIEPDLESIMRQLGRIPHTLRDSAGQVYLCTSRKEDVRVGAISTSAASAISWAAKWIAVFEMWMAGDVTSAEFEGHTF